MKLKIAGLLLLLGGAALADEIKTGDVPIAYKEAEDIMAKKDIDGKRKKTRKPLLAAEEKRKISMIPFVAKETPVNFVVPYSLANVGIAPYCPTCVITIALNDSPKPGGKQ